MVDYKKGMTIFVKPLMATALALTLGACAQLGIGRPDIASAPAADTAADADTQALPDATDTDALAAPTAPVLTSAPPPPPAARTQEALDTTTSAQRAQASAPVASAAQGRSLGTTIASLGSPSEPGFWLKTPLVTSQTTGRVTNKANGKSSAVTLIPIEGPATGGSRLSLPAMRLIGASLTDLTEVEVTQGS